MAHADTPRFFDEDTIPVDVMLVLKAASLLETGEFRVFEIAYRRWFGHAGEEKTIERYFVPYMFNDVVPQWVRHFARHVLELDRRHALDPRAFGLHPRPPNRDARRRGALYAAWIVLFLAVLIAAARLGAGTFGDYDTCMLPPCYTQNR
ncbi:hypothetical protein HW532_03335 [Kaustia mangrovi]|uniref:Uncharacterized protein n=1 Tax=Kaustia mangrovi TaxID=2593653 RepID=A0A7S8C1W7_9HYPH|nr:hypothetical protein [Kaustia mangrovi]QPC41831.1 hypothetical protein HW532_03335 [Kaustia mangrovi]